ncbi:DEAD/DEAH box helicase [Clostridium sp. DL1XJH146]
MKEQQAIIEEEKIINKELEQLQNQQQEKTPRQLNKSLPAFYPKEIDELAIESIDNKNKLITNNDSSNLLYELQRSLSECQSFYFSVAFINFSGLQLLLDNFKELEDRGIKGKIITSTYLNFTEPKALKKIKEFENIDVKVFITDKEVGFHTKAYIFENKYDYKVIIGSSNITQSALKSNVEWNVQVISKADDVFIRDVLREYDNLWNLTNIVDDEFLEEYSRFINELKKDVIGYKPIRANQMQKKAIKSLNRLREHGDTKALAIAATGTGKTYMSAFDVNEYKPNKLLFIVHREEILRKAKDTFTSLLKNDFKTTGLYTGNSKEIESDYLFSTMQTMTKHFDEFSSEEFDYIIIDEAHHASSPSYRRVIEYFKPKFLLGMTATPERGDNEDIFEIFNNNIAIEVRLNEALEQELIIPFHYFGITDIDGIDLEDVNLDNVAEISKRLMVNRRVDFIIEKMKFYDYDGEKLKSVGFCANKEHANYMADEFNKRGIQSICLTGEDSVDYRGKIIDRLENDKDSLKVIFTVDIFNEGVDIPSINSILLLRPTNSPVIFIQQLGRGLRKYKNKSFLTVLDFIGNHNRAFLIAIALCGSRFYDKDSLKVAVATSFANAPGCTNIQMDRIATERILDQLNNENFNTMKYLKEEFLKFKGMNGRKIPFYLMDYIKYEGAPDPIKFIDKAKTYPGFVTKIEKDDKLNKLLSDNNFYDILRDLSSYLPLKRMYEFSILNYLMENGEVSFEEAKNEILKYITEVDKDSVYHAMECLNGNYLDSGEISRKIRLCDMVDNSLIISDRFKNILANKEYKRYIQDVIYYGINRYKKEFGEKYFGVPFFNLYSQYSMKDTALLSNYRKIHSSFRGSGLLKNGNEFFLFIDLHKEEDIKDSINYKDKFIDRNTFQWQTQNNTTTTSSTGQDIIKNKERKIKLHLFVRKYREIDKKIQPFIYIGKGDATSYSGEKPITVILKLQNRIPVKLYVEFVKKV